MPIYEYECAQCGQIEEAIQRFSDEPLVACKSCSGKVNKLISQSTFHLKGSGWYVTDYAGKKTGESAPAKTKTETSTKNDAGAPAKTTEKTSSKPAASTS